MLKCLGLPHMDAAHYMRWFRSGDHAMSAVKNLVFRRCLSWRNVFSCIAVETHLSEAIWRIAVNEFSVPVLASF